MSALQLAFKERFWTLSRSMRASVAVIFAIAILFRVAVALWLPDKVVWTDGLRYERVANNLVAGSGFGSVTDNRLSVPTQPLLIAATELLFGKSYQALRLVFATIGSLSCVLAYLLTRRLFLPEIALLTGLILAGYPFYVYLSALFEYPQTFFIFMLLVALLLLYNFLESGRLLNLFACGIAFGLSVLSVPTVLIFLPFLLIILHSSVTRIWLTSVAIVFLGASIPLGAWTVRNYLAYGQPILVNEASGINFWIANNESYYLHGKDAVVVTCNSRSTSDFCLQYRAIDRELISRKLSETDFVAADEKAGWENGMKFIREHPQDFALLTVRKFFQFWSPDPDAVNYGAAQGGSFRVWPARLTYLPILGLAAVGIWQSLRSNWRRPLPIFLLILSLSTPYYLFLPTTRYRLPIDLFLIMFASAALARGIGLDRAPNSRADC